MISAYQTAKSPPTPQQFSVIIVTKHITDALKIVLEQALISVSDIDDVWIVHSGDASNVADLAKHHNAQFVPYEWNGKYPKKRQWCLDSVQTKYEWVFFLDADELMFPRLIEEINKTLHAQNAKNYAGFFVKGGYVWDGQPLKYGLKNNKIALIHKKRMMYPVLDDLTASQMGEIEGHYQPVVTHPDFKIGQLKTNIDHYAFTDASAWEARHKKYAKWEAYMIENNAYPKDPIPYREWLKALFRRTPMRPAIAFFHCYVLKRGFLDGKKGYQFAKTRAHYYSMVNKARAILRSSP